MSHTCLWFLERTSLLPPQGEGSRVGDQFVIYWQNNDLLHPKTMIYNVKDRNSIIKFQQLNSELSHMKHFQEVFKLDLKAVKIQLGHFIEMFHKCQLRIKLLKFYNGSQWSSYPLHYKSLFLGAINHCFANKSQTDPSPWIGLWFIGKTMIYCTQKQWFTM